jgi:subtilisin family serine protease
VNNSYGLYRCSPLGDIDDHPYLSVVREMRQKAVVCFAAGNNHADVKCKHPEADCSPNSIWAVNSVDEVLTVGAVDENGRNDILPWANSSRGPGEWSNTSSKPDVVAPCYGETVWGDGYSLMPWWGTSGACPQAAGLAALIMSAAPSLSPAEVRRVIKATAKPLLQSENCVGRGMLDCEAAIDAALSS